MRYWYFISFEAIGCVMGVLDEKQKGLWMHDIK